MGNIKCLFFCSNSDNKINQNIINPNEFTKPKNRIHEKFNKPLRLKNGELIEYKGTINNPISEEVITYYLFEFDSLKYYIKNNNKKFGICRNKEELLSDDFLSGKINKIPSIEKVNRSINNIKNKTDSVYLVEGGLTLSHTNSTFSSFHNQSGSNNLISFEYVMVFNNLYTVLSYSHIHGLSIFYVQ